MTVTTRYLCRKEIATANDVVRVSVRRYGFLASEFCADYGKPVVQFLTRVEKKLTSKKPQSVGS
jgi:hypothetical protein